MAFFYASWLDPCKVRRITFVGREKMILFDDMMASESLKLFDKGVIRDQNVLDTYGTHQLGVRSGDVWLPRFAPHEPLSQECEAFICACLDNIPNPAIGDLPLKVTKVLSALDYSMNNGGCPVNIKDSLKLIAPSDQSFQQSWTVAGNSEAQEDV
jgi:predicted dehydrogenase